MLSQIGYLVVPQADWWAPALLCASPTLVVGATECLVHSAAGRNGYPREAEQVVLVKPNAGFNTMAWMSRRGGECGTVIDFFWMCVSEWPNAEVYWTMNPWRRRGRTLKTIFELTAFGACVLESCWKSIPTRSLFSPTPLWEGRYVWCRWATLIEIIRYSLVPVSMMAICYDGEAIHVTNR